MSLDNITRDWIRNESDERAAANGCRFDVLRGAWTVYWIERYCKLYEGEGYAGKPLILHGCQECKHQDFQAINDWDESGQASAIERARLFAECVAAGHRIDWQYECFMRIFGWVRKSDKWKRDVRRFRKSSIWIPKKSGKSPTLAALGMYLLAGDGEPGQKVFLAAKDGEQARTNAGKHAVEMWLQSEELRQECTLNKNIMQITHEPSRSIMRPLSSSNSRTQQSKEGLNGSVLVDETHVVDRAFVDIISRAGISRSEPLFAEFSTAGDNPDGYGKESFDYSVDVLSGKANDDEHFAAIYAAPQDVTDEELEKNFDRYADMANPALGRLIEAKEIRTDYERSKVTIEKLATFKKYRLNIWQHSSNPWIRPSAWQACAAEYTEADLLGKECFIAYDLALNWDTAAIVCVFPWGEKNGLPRYRLWPYFFLPEISARATKDKAHWYNWHDIGHMRLTEGNSTDYSLIRETIKACHEKFNVCAPVAYDKKFAEAFSQQMEIEDGIPREEFPQSPNHFIEPMELFLGAIIDGRLEHPNNEVLNWQAGNATIDAKNGMLIKPRGEPVKKIDGPVSAVMAVGRAATQPVNTSVYESRGIATLGESPEPVTTAKQEAPDWFNSMDWGEDD